MAATETPAGRGSPSLLIVCRKLPPGVQARYYHLRDLLVIDPSIPRRDWHLLFQRALDDQPRRPHLRLVESDERQPGSVA